MLKSSLLEKEWKGWEGEGKVKEEEEMGKGKGGRGKDMLSDGRRGGT